MRLREYERGRDLKHFGATLMTSSSDSPFKPPPTVICLCQNNCLGFGKKVHHPSHVCADCLKRHDPQQLRVWANNDTTALSLIDEEVSRKQVLKQNIEAHGRYLCAFEDPDYQHCRWRQSDLNLRGTRLNCKAVRIKGAACSRCWNKHLQKIEIVLYFTPTGHCHEEARRAVTRSEETEEGIEGGEDDLEGYDEVLS